MKGFVSFLVGLALLLALLGIVIHAPDSSQGAASRRLEFYENGLVQLEYDVDGRGRLHGPMTEYWPTGEINVLSDWNHGIAVGASRHFEKDGMPIP